LLAVKQNTCFARSNPASSRTKGRTAIAYRGNRSGRDRDNNEPRVNHRIRVPQVRLIGEDNQQQGVIPTDEARRRAEVAGLDLVEVSPNERPPVCKIMDYGKFKYEQKKRANETKKKQRRVEVKEIKFRPKTDTHDFETKVRKLKAFIEDGHKVKVTIMFRGREIIHQNIGVDICDRVVKALNETEETIQVEQPARMEGRSMFMMLAPVSKKGKAPKKVEPEEAAA
jgi:translation initiation factor IF-3